ncbi:MAG: hypothetical protein ACRDZY_10725 [Acidimicrobiales bacterium]
MSFKSGYGRFARIGGRPWPIWVRRGVCRACGHSHALIPDFCLVGRLDAAEVIGSGVARAVAGEPMATVAAALDVPYTTARGWRRRHRSRAPVLTSGFAALAVALGASAPVVSVVPERAALEALGVAWRRARERFGDLVVTQWRFWSLMSGGAVLARARNAPWAAIGGRRLIPPVP